MHFTFKREVIAMAVWLISPLLLGLLVALLRAIVLK